MRRTSRVQVSSKSEFQTKLTVDKSKKKKKPQKNKTGCLSGLDYETMAVLWSAAEEVYDMLRKQLRVNTPLLISLCHF